MTQETLDSYCQILGISENASIEDIKRAYRQKAKLLHPDKNKNSDAHEQFILLNEAYDCLLSIKSGAQTVTIESDPYSYEDWFRQTQEEARQRAREYAQMRYEEYKKTDQYKKSQAAKMVVEHLYFISCVALMLSPLWGILFNGGLGFFAGILITFVTVQYWAGIFREKIELDFPAFFESILIVVKTRTFRLFVLIPLNIYLFVRFTLNTQVTLLTLGLIFLSLHLLIFLASKKLAILKPVSWSIIFLALVPTLFNLFFLFNFIFSSNPTIEKYSFVHKTEWYGSRRRHNSGSYQKTSYIDLENNKYEEYPWFRMFLDFEAMQYKSEITYTFEDGLFGLRVLKGFEFTK
ncbi:MAG TPA: hypothetical protein DGG95_03905 [Cytophagales bacterium]|jgi:hypothetical protein|nr:hypothetical protein [Cytophagales bacterium]